MKPCGTLGLGEWRLTTDDGLHLDGAALVRATAHGSPRLRVLPDRSALMDDFAQAMVAEIRAAQADDRPCRLIIPVGPRGQYPLFVAACRRERLDLSRLHLFAMDEYLDWEGRALPPTHPLSFRGFLERHLLAPLPAECGFSADRLVLPDPLRLDDYHARIEAVGGVDCCFGGVGVHGHVAFNEPFISRFTRISVEGFRASRTRLMPLAPETIVMNSIRGNGGNFADFPTMAVTCGMVDILAARRIRLYLDGGPFQRTVLRRALFDPPGVDYPVTLLSGHADYVLATDAETAAPVGEA